MRATFPATDRSAPESDSVSISAVPLTDEMCTGSGFNGFGAAAFRCVELWGVLVGGQCCVQCLSGRVGWGMWGYLSLLFTPTKFGHVADLLA